MVFTGVALVTVQEDVPRLRRGGGLDPAEPDCWTQTERPRATFGGLVAAKLTNFSRHEGVSPFRKMFLINAL